MFLGVAMGKVVVGAPLGEQRHRSHFFGCAVADAAAQALACPPGEIIVQRAVARVASEASSAFRFAPSPTAMRDWAEKDPAQATCIAAATLCGRSWSADAGCSGSSGSRVRRGSGGGSAAHRGDGCCGGGNRCDL